MLSPAWGEGEGGRGKGRGEGEGRKGKGEGGKQIEKFSQGIGERASEKWRRIRRKGGRRGKVAMRYSRKITS